MVNGLMKTVSTTWFQTNLFVADPTSTNGCALMLIINSDDVRNALPMELAIDTMKQALGAISSGDANVPSRIHLELAGSQGETLVMPAHVSLKNIESLAVKVVSVFGNNSNKGLPTVTGAVIVMDTQTGQPVALIEGATLTAIRTAAASAAATDLLAKSSADSLAIIGSGVQVLPHVRAISCVRQLKRIVVYSRNREKCEQRVAELSDHLPSGCAVSVAEDADAAVSAAEIICTLTAAPEPMFDANSVSLGSHINAVGSHTPAAAEVPANVVAIARIFVDETTTAMRAGDLARPLRNGVISRDDILGEVGHLISGQVQGRTAEDQITLFKSVGNAAEDSLAAHVTLNNALKMGIGTQVAW